MEGNQEDKKSKIDTVEDALYSRNTDGLFIKRRHILTEDKAEESYASNWKEPEVPQHTEMHIKIPYIKILAGAFIFFVLAVGFVFYKFFIGSNIISGDNIAITASGPVSLAGGETLPLNLDIKNNNASALQNVNLLVEYPVGAVDPNNLANPLPRYTEALGTINPGADLTRLVKAAIFGQANMQQTVKITVSYNIAGSNATFTKEKDYTFLISSSPVDLQISGPTEVNANQQTNFTVTVTSNSLTILPSVALKIAYPFGFNYISSSLAPDQGSGNSIFVLGNLAPGTTQTFTISGVVQGQDGEERVLNFSVGTLGSNNAIITPFNLASLDMSIKKSAIGVVVKANGDINDTVPIAVGNKVNIDFAWQNNLPDKINNMALQISLIGQTFDPTSFNVPNGFYNSSNNTITFDHNSVSTFGTVNPNDQDTLSFDFTTFDPNYNPTIAFGSSNIIMNILVTGDTSAGTHQTLYSGTKTLQLTSSINLLARGFRTIGPFVNSGPVPPKVNAQSTYTITWTATDSFNNINNAIVSATLPANVVWLGQTSPSSENISYNQSSGQITWNVGNMKAKTGTTYSPHEVSFQLAVTPSVTQVGQDISLLGQSTITGVDAYSGATITGTGPEVTTSIVSDPQYVDGIGKVTQ